MAKPAATLTTDTAPEGRKSFDHGSRFVTLLVPANAKHETTVRRQLDERYGEALPPSSNAVKVAEISPETVLYIAHPMRVRKKVKDRTGKDVWKRVIEVHVSEPIDLADCTDQPRRGARILDYNKICQAINRACKNDPAGWFFGAHLSGFHKSDFTEATIQLLTR